MWFGHYCLPSYFADRDGPPDAYMRRLVEFFASSEALGFDALWANEHHFHPYGGMLPSTPLMLAALAQRTTRVRLGTSIVVLPLHNPIQVAEQLAMVDLMSGGRVELGVGRGFVLYDYEVMGVPVEEGQERTTESLAVILKAWSGEPFSHHGKYFHYQDLGVWPRPVQRPHPPVAVACASNPASFEWTARHGYKLLTVAYIKPLDRLAALTAHYRDAWRDAGHDPAACRIHTHFQVVVAESAREARRTAEEALERYVHQHEDAVALSKSQQLQAQAAATEEVRIERLVDECRVIAGTPDECVAAITRARDVIGMTDFDCAFYFGGMEFARAQRSLHLFATAVMPRLRDTLPLPHAAAEAVSATGAG